MIIIANSYASVNKEKNDVLKLMKDLRNNSWFICEVAYDKSHRNGISKRLYGFTESNDLSTAACNQSSGCRSFEAVKSRTTSRRCPVYFFGSKNDEYTENFNQVNRFVGIDLDDLDWDKFYNYTIPFPCFSYYVEVSPSGTGAHIFCLVSESIYQHLQNKYQNKAYVTSKNPIDTQGMVHHVEYRFHDCCLTYSGKPVMYSLAVPTVTEKMIKFFTEKFSGRKFSSNDSLSEYAFWCAVELYKQTTIFDNLFFYSVLSEVPFIKESVKWQNKLPRWLKDSCTLSSIKEAVDNPTSKYGVLNDLNTPLTPITEEETVATPISVPDPVLNTEKVPDSLLLPLFRQHNPNYLYTDKGWVRYEEGHYRFLKRESEEVLPFVEDFYRRSFPTKSLSSLERLAKSSIRFCKLPPVIEFKEGTFKPAEFSNPSTSKNFVRTSGDTFLNLSDCIYNLDLEVCMPHTEDFLSTTKLSISSKHLARRRGFKGSKWQAFLTSTFCEDEQTISAVKRFFGYVISGDLNQQKILVLKGEAGSGKGTLVSTIIDVLGCTAGATNLQALNERFGVAGLMDKKLVVIPEVPKNMKAYGSAWEVLKSIASADPLAVEFKGRDSFTAVLPCKVIICSNYDIIYDGDMNALNRRFIYALTPQSFGGVKGKEVNYKELLKDEYDIIFKWLVEGYQEYKKYGLFQPEKSLTYQKENAEDQIAQFVENYLEPADSLDEVLLNKTLKATFEKFCIDEDIPIQYRTALRNLPSKVRTYCARNWFQTSIENLDYHCQKERGLRGLRIKSEDTITEIHPVTSKEIVHTEEEEEDTVEYLNFSDLLQE